MTKTMTKAQHRSWLSPFVAVLFAMLAISGVLMMFHIRVPGMHSLHEWGGVLFLILAVVHLCLNWKMFVSYFRNKTAMAGACAGLLVVVLFLLAAPGNTDYAKGGHYNRHVASQTAGYRQ